jgi:hypothetical protein
VRTDLWGFVPDERFSKEELIDEKYQGIRPAPGYPACPDHRVKQPLFALLGAADVGMQVTESLAMQPGASVSGFYFSHPASTYFNVGPIGDSQAEDMAARSGWMRRRSSGRWGRIWACSSPAAFRGHRPLQACQTPNPAERRSIPISTSRSTASA